jgi:aspartyl-tRNA(Asn)/glutamyl-tRNA(Gln) amidotransferase subunit B
MNSFRFLEQGINAEIARQRAILEEGGEVVQETLHFDPRTGAITSLRSKEEAHDYRYFPEPDLVPVPVTEAMLDRARGALPELPADRERRYEDELGLATEDARFLAWRVDAADFFEAALASDGADPKQLANWTRQLAAREEDLGATKVQPGALAQLAGMVSSRTVTQGAARQVLDRLVAEGGDPARVVEAEGLAAIGGGDELRPVVQAALDANPDVVEKLRAGNMKPIGVIVGRVMRETRGRADGGEVTRLARELLGLG